MATTVEDRGVIIEEPAERKIVRHPTDLLRLIVAIVATILGFLLATTLNNLSEAITVEVIQGFDHLPSPVVIVFVNLVGLLALIGPFVTIGYFITKRQWRRLRLALLAVVLAFIALWLLESFLVSRFSAPVLSTSPPSWVCAPGTDLANVGLYECIPDPDISNPLVRYGSLVALTAFFSAIMPYLNRRWKRFGWITIILVALTPMLSHLQPPTDEFLAIGIAYRFLGKFKEADAYGDRGIEIKRIGS